MSNNIAIIQSRLYGDTTHGDYFDDIAEICRNQEELTLSVSHPIKEMTIGQGAVIDGISVTYQQVDSNGNNDTTKIITHGTDPATAKMTLTTITLSKDENIIAICGRHGHTKDYGTRLVNISFVVYDESTGKARVTQPIGGNEGTPFRVTANGQFLGFGGYATYISTDIAGDHKKRGLYGLSFSDLGYRTT